MRLSLWFVALAMPHIAMERIARRLRLFTLSTVVLACGPLLIRSHESESWTQRDTVVHGCTHTASTSWHVAVTMAIALIWALIEYARLFLLLITDEEAVRFCYQRRCSAADIIEQGVPIQTQQAKGSRSDDEIQKKSGFPEDPIRPQERVKSDQISTNMPISPANLSDDSDAEETKAKCRGPVLPESISRATRICGCEEEDYLVAMEDDVRRPCGAPTNVVRPGHADMQPAPTAVVPSNSSSNVKEEAKQGCQHKAASIPVPSSASGAGAFGATHLTAHERDEAEHHFKDELLPSAEETLMDAL